MCNLVREGKSSTSLNPHQPELEDRHCGGDQERAIGKDIPDQGSLIVG